MSLSDKILEFEKGNVDFKCYATLISTRDLKASIKRIKEKLCTCPEDKIGIIFIKCKSCKEIDKEIGRI